MIIKNPKLEIQNKKGFTLTELIIVIGILVILIAISASTFIFFRKESDLNSNSEKIINILRRVQNKTLASEGLSQYGVYFDDSVSPHQYTLFKGASYASRDVSFDEIYKLTRNIEIYEIDLNGGNEVVFEQLTGVATQSGNVSLRLKSDLTETQIIYVENSGLIGISIPSVPASVPVKDSRHVHFNYTRVIDTATENLTLTFDGSVIETIVIINNINEDGQIYWEGEVEVGGDTQIIKIHSHNLNNPDTDFCIHRDRRYNNKSLVINISGDITGTLIEYSADGLTTNSTSINVNGLEWQ